MYVFLRWPADILVTTLSVVLQITSVLQIIVEKHWFNTLSEDSLVLQQ